MDNLNFVQAMKKLSPRARMRFCKVGTRIVKTCDIRAPGIFRETGDSIVAAHVPHNGRQVLGEMQ